MSPVEREGPEQTNELTTSDGRKVTVKLPPGLAERITPTGSETRMRPRPEEPPDTTPTLIRHIPPHGAG